MVVNCRLNMFELLHLSFISFLRGLIHDFGAQVHVCLDLTGPIGIISFGVNASWVGEAFRLPPLQPGVQLKVFPHLLVKNMAVRVTFGAGPVQPPGHMGSFRPWQVCCKMQLRILIFRRGHIVPCHCKCLSSQQMT